jgi:hypothetical protein
MTETFNKLKPKKAPGEDTIINANLNAYQIMPLPTFDIYMHQHNVIFPLTGKRPKPFTNQGNANFYLKIVVQSTYYTHSGSF